jgi:hypothetical protein
MGVIRNLVSPLVDPALENRKQLSATTAPSEPGAEEQARASNSIVSKAVPIGKPLMTMPCSINSFEGHRGSQGSKAAGARHGVDFGCGL